MPPMYPLKPTDPEYRKYDDYFNDNWKHALKIAKVRKIFRVRDKELAASYRWRRHKRYGGKSVHRARLLFHGTTRACNAGEEKGSGKMKWCNKSDCGLCGIMKNSFKVSKSSIIKIRYVRQNERPQYMMVASQKRTAPDPGYDSVEGLAMGEGGILTERETVVYRDDAIVPVAVIMYETSPYKRIGMSGIITPGAPLAAAGGVGARPLPPRPARRTFLSKLFGP
ncbi:uncharacterized protein FSUBG_4245 [Fusarium subglutinans]|uniref:Uncharacterized protein n=1 Tax=Gibberella subglutinans TaxID=42677 RepID=A0A8H5Q5D0_GIBSU|nr:uncharacterized protein FSUBG_4245 [Fusarium subglutinans]KAF5609090.1 hypothetical protein FSUBG_4245 [Fusarium subglutinans]